MKSARRFIRLSGTARRRIEAITRFGHANRIREPKAAIAAFALRSRRLAKGGRRA